MEGVSSVTDMCTSVQVTQEIMSRDGGAGGGSLPRGSLLARRDSLRESESTFVDLGLQGFTHNSQPTRKSLVRSSIHGGNHLLRSCLLPSIRIRNSTKRN